MRTYKTKISYPSTLLIPEELMVVLASRLKHRNLQMYLHYLPGRPLPPMNSTGKWKTLYQQKGQKLRRFNFRPDEGDWQKLSMLSVGNGQSRCLLFVLMMLADVQGVPTQNSQNIRAVFVFLQEKNQFLERRVMGDLKDVEGLHFLSEIMRT
jgi:hypothetical protein